MALQKENVGLVKHRTLAQHSTNDVAVSLGGDLLWFPLDTRYNLLSVHWMVLREFRFLSNLMAVLWERSWTPSKTSIPGCAMLNTQIDSLFCPFRACRCGIECSHDNYIPWDILHYYYSQPTKPIYSLVELLPFQSASFKGLHFDLGFSLFSNYGD